MLQQAIDKGTIKDAYGWFEKSFKDLSSLTGNAALQKGGSRLTNFCTIGKMYLFHYDPKHKDTLPLYDRFPLIFPFNYASNGFLGLNFHYLPYMQRARLLDALSSLIVKSEGLTDTTRISLSYDAIRAVARSVPYDSCVKHYLNSHIRSRFLLINPAEWSKALFLPLDNFVYK